MSSKRNPNARDDWRTPKELVARIHQFAPIVFDPATTKDNPTGAEYIRTESCDPDGLATEWHRFDGLIFTNPPYRKPWYDKIYAELNDFVFDSEFIALLPAKPGAVYFQQIARLCQRVLFVRGRLTFDGCTEPAPFESALLYRGERALRFTRYFEELGWIV